jgi:hypothetical protein
MATSGIIPMGNTYVHAMDRHNALSQPANIEQVARELLVIELPCEATSHTEPHMVSEGNTSKLSVCMEGIERMIKNSTVFIMPNRFASRSRPPNNRSLHTENGPASSCKCRACIETSTEGAPVISTTNLVMEHYNSSIGKATLLPDAEEQDNSTVLSENKGLRETLRMKSQSYLPLHMMIMQTKPCILTGHSHWSPH